MLAHVRTSLAHRRLCSSLMKSAPAQLPTCLRVLCCRYEGITQKLKVGTQDPTISSCLSLSPCLRMSRVAAICNTHMNEDQECELSGLAVQSCSSVPVMRSGTCLSGACPPGRTVHRRRTCRRRARLRSLPAQPSLAAQTWMRDEVFRGCGSGQPGSAEPRRPQSQHWPPARLHCATVRTRMPRAMPRGLESVAGIDSPAQSTSVYAPPILYEMLIRVLWQDMSPRPVHLPLLWLLTRACRPWKRGSPCSGNSASACAAHGYPRARASLLSEMPGCRQTFLRHH